MRIVFFSLADLHYLKISLISIVDNIFCGVIIMYECYNVRRFLKLLVLDAIIFGLCFVFFFIGRNIAFSAGNLSADEEERVFMPAIMYHSVHEGAPQEYVVTPAQLESDLKYLKGNGYASVTAQQLADYTRGVGELPEKPVLLTFDDGFYNNLSILVPLLEKYDMYAIVSVVGAFAENKAAADPHNDKYSYLTWEDINDIIASGRVEIGNHTYNMHSVSGGRKGCAIMDGESCETYSQLLSEDISLLQTELHDHSGIVPFVFAYPYGSLCKESIPVLKENGFLITMTCFERPNYITRNADCLYNIDRYNRSGLYSTEEFMEKLLRDPKQ